MILATHGIVSNSGGLNIPLTLNNNLFASFNCDIAGEDSYSGIPIQGVGGITTSTGKINNATSFNGMNAFLNYTLIPDRLKFTSDLSFNLWINPTTSKSQSLIGCYNYQSADYGYFYFLDVNNKINFFWVNSGSNVITSNNSIALNTWTMVTITRDIANSTLKIYINGVLDYTYTNSLVNSISYYSTMKSNIGALNNEAYFFSGKMDMINIWTRAITQTEITGLYNNNIGLQYPYPT